MTCSTKTSCSSRAATAWYCLVFQVVGANDYYGYGDDTAVPDRAEADLAVNTIARLFDAT